MAVAREERRSFNKPVVVLADMDKADMDDAVAEALGDDFQLDVITRQGCPFDPEALETIAAGALSKTRSRPHAVVIGTRCIPHCVHQGMHTRSLSCSQTVRAPWKQTRDWLQHWRRSRACLGGWLSKTWWCSRLKPTPPLFFQPVRLDGVDAGI